MALTRSIALTEGFMTKPLGLLKLPKFAKLPPIAFKPSSLKGFVYLLKFSSFWRLLDFSSSWFLLHESARTPELIETTSRLSWCQYNNEARAAAATSMTTTQTNAIRYPLLCFSSLTRAVSTLTSTIAASDRAGAFRLMDSPRTRTASATAWPSPWLFLERNFKQNWYF